jgi:hypothetical protein
MKYTVLMIVGCMLSNCAVIQAVTGSPIQARDVISSINTAHNLGKYSEPAAREELEREVKAQLKRWETQ